MLKGTKERCEANYPSELSLSITEINEATLLPGKCLKAAVSSIRIDTTIISTFKMRTPGQRHILAMNLN